jgi:NADH-quinone oxidoreductase subunit L
MVAAGVFLVARVFPLMAAVPVGADHNLVPVALQVVTWVGAITAVFAALVAVAQNDIKRILAYSTVSQLGYMFMGLGAGGVAVGMFHLITHAFFKALLFLGSGSVIHGCHEEQDIRRMGGLRKFMPVTFATYAVGMMALSGVPLFFSGFWSKDEILHSAAEWSVSRVPFWMGVFGALLTAFYMTRQVCYVFFGRYRGGHAGSSQPAHSHASPHQDHAQPHESPRVMTLPLVILAVCAVLLSVIGTPLWPWFHDYLSGHGAGEEAGYAAKSGVLGVMILSSVVALTGIGLGWRIYGRIPAAQADQPDALQTAQPDVYAVLQRKFFVDELYELSVIRWNAMMARISDWLDRFLWGGLVQAVSVLVLGLSWLNRLVDEFVVNLGFDKGCDSLRTSGRWFSWFQNGQVQRYLRVLGLAMVVFTLAFLWGIKK